VATRGEYQSVADTKSATRSRSTTDRQPVRFRFQKSNRCLCRPLPVDRTSTKASATALEKLRLNDSSYEPETSTGSASVFDAVSSGYLHMEIIQEGSSAFQLS